MLMREGEIGRVHIVALFGGLCWARERNAQECTGATNKMKAKAANFGCSVSAGEGPGTLVVVVGMLWTWCFSLQ